MARVGELDLYDDKDGVTPEDIRLVKAKIHEDYSPVQFTNDIAILTLEKPPTVRKLQKILVISRFNKLLNILHTHRIKLK